MNTTIPYKRLILTLLFTKAICGLAQPSFGVEGGVSFSNTVIKAPAQVSYGEDRKYALGLYAGIFSAFKISEEFSFTTSILFSQRGWNESGRAKDIIRLNYLEVPLLLSYSPYKKIKLEAGPNASLLISTNNNLKKFYESYDLGINGCAKVQLTNSLFLTVRYYRGFRTLTTITFNDINGNVIGTSKEYSQSFQAGISYQIK